MTDPTRDDDRDLVAEIQADLARGKAQIDRLIANAIVAAVLLVTLFLLVSLARD